MPALHVSQAKGRRRYNKKMLKSLISAALAAALRTGHGDQAFGQTTPTTTIKG